MSQGHAQAQARTTARTRAEIKASSATLVALAERFNITRATAAKWKCRATPHDLSGRQHMRLLPLDDLLVVMREFIYPAASRSGLDRCLRRHGAAKLRDLQAQARVDEGEGEAAIKTVKDEEPGFLYVAIKCLPQMPDEAARRAGFSGASTPIKVTPAA